MYPFVVPLRPVAGSLMADVPAPAREYTEPIYRKVAGFLAERGLDAETAVAGCARCQACSSLNLVQQAGAAPPCGSAAGAGSAPPLLQIGRRPGVTGRSAGVVTTSAVDAACGGRWRVGLNALLGVDPLLCRPVRDPDGLAAHHRIRHAVFVAEQHVFAESDVDAHDARDRRAARAGPARRAWPRAPSGCTRSAAGEWLGDRLAVLPEFRAINIGGSAGAVRGGHRERAGRSAHAAPTSSRPTSASSTGSAGGPTGPAESYVGRPHLPMAIELGSPICPWLAGRTLHPLQRCRTALSHR